ncbi:MAG: hypothetical protein UY76_C0021G0002 [Candidatus Uhrbacteria bacterium GW2011_GWA2_52_8d]|uniref:Uncharacterized protein n=1 Tax=Candidatus Uhrbacteria bacterium GW2011_GWA2_52_8d TaxID=1618979 RepID=A0A0G1XNZ9_9BACT|nr:MAG: hypothetical protein UY76_C0021G0002 [Candidatus Uhrbacteria bacterium GW2011_GWA2_52_8d]
MFVFLSVLAALTGCATVKHVDPETGHGASYIGTAHGAVAVIGAMDRRPYDLASKAMDRGMPTSLVRDADSNVRFSAGYSYSGYVFDDSVGGFAFPTGVYVPGYGVAPIISSNRLPLLAEPSVSVPQPPTGQGIVPCPDGRPWTVAQQAACAALDASTALDLLTE